MWSAFRDKGVAGFTCLHLLCFVFLFSCKKERYDYSDKKVIEKVQCNAYVLNSSYESHNANTLYFTTEIGMTAGIYANDFSSIPLSVFENIKIGGDSLIVDSVKWVGYNDNNSFSNLLVVDRGEDGLAKYDENWDLLSGIHHTVTGTLASSNQMGIGHFSVEGGTVFDVSAGANPFELTLEDMVPRYYTYNTPTGPTKNLYDALLYYVENYPSYSSHANKNITVLTLDGQGQNQTSINTLINKARANNIKINTLLIAPKGSPVKFLSAKTGGFASLVDGYVFSCSPATAVNRILGTLASTHRILSKNVGVYRIYGRIVRNATFFSGQAVEFLYPMKYVYNSYDSLGTQLPIYVKVP